MQIATTSNNSFMDALRASWRNSRAMGWALLPLRLYLAAVFLYAGYSKISNPQFLNPHAKGYFGHFIGFMAKGSPISGFLLHVVQPHAQLFGALVAYGEFAIGLGALLGILFRPAAFFGLFLNIIYYLSATWHARPFYTSDDLDFIFAWSAILLAGASGVALTLDPWLSHWLLARLSPTRRAQLAPVLAFLLGVSPTAPLPRRASSPAPAKSPNTPATKAATANAQKSGSIPATKATNNASTSGVANATGNGTKTSNATKANSTTANKGASPVKGGSSANARSTAPSRPIKRSTPSRRG